jgi:uncharacterized protein (TIGR00255 family)
MESMTGYGRSETVSGGFKITAESRSINGRHLDLKLRLPQELNPYDTVVRSMIRGMFSRGTFSLTVHVHGTAPPAPALDPAAARKLIRRLRDLKRELALPGDIDLDILTRFPQVTQTYPLEVDPETLWLKSRSVVTKALAAHKRSRRREGVVLKRVIREHFNALSSLVTLIRRQSPRALKDLKLGLRERAGKLAGPLEINGRRLEEEVALLASRRDFTEEIDRLKSHLASFRKVMNQSGPIGRNMEFLTQEIHRELTTIASKASGREISQLTIQARVELEKIKEQVYNVE